jgi:hypothetical protein
MRSLLLIYSISFVFSLWFFIASHILALPAYEIVEYKSNYFYKRALKTLISNKVCPVAIYLLLWHEKSLFQRCCGMHGKIDEFIKINP